jgi:hypothetical protein
MTKLQMITAPLCAAAFFGMASSASAATYLFSFQGPSSSQYGDIVVSGEFTTSKALEVGGGPVPITGVSGTVTNGVSPVVDGTIGPLVGYAHADNELYSTGINSGDFYSFGGVSFSVTGTIAGTNTGATAYYNLFGWNGVTNLLVSTIDPVGYPGNGTPATVPVGNEITSSVAAVPEPATWAMMLLGVGMIGAGLRMARRKSDMELTAA